MKLRNKRTGEIVEAHDIDLIGNVYLKIFRAGDYDTKKYNSLAELNEEWEDCEETKQNALRVMILTLANFIENEPSDNVDLEDCKDMLKKLEAWERLKDEGFRFKTWYGGSKNIDYEITSLENETYIPRQICDDLDLLFGGKE